MGSKGERPLLSIAGAVFMTGCDPQFQRRMMCCWHPKLLGWNLCDPEGISEDFSLSGSPLVG